MQDRNHQGTKQYRLELSAPHGSSRLIEFAAQGPESVLLIAERDGGGQNVTIFEDGRPLGCLRHARGHGFWTIAPGPAIAA